LTEPWPRLSRRPEALALPAAAVRRAPRAGVDRAQRFGTELMPWCGATPIKIQIQHDLTSQ